MRVSTAQSSCCQRQRATRRSRTWMRAPPLRFRSHRFDRLSLGGAAMSDTFDLERFVADCRAAREADPSHKLVREVVARAVSDPAAVLKGLGEPKRGEVKKLYHSPELTILNVIW